MLLQHPYVTKSAQAFRAKTCVRQHSIYRKANGYLCVAYWIAFGPHGPRALPPPGENWMVFRWTMYGVGISFVIFWVIRQFARPAPGTMTAQYQEMTNEYLKVSELHISTMAISGYQEPLLKQSIMYAQLTYPSPQPEPKNRTHHRYLFPRVYRQRNGAEQAETWATSKRR